MIKVSIHFSVRRHNNELTYFIHFQAEAAAAEEGLPPPDAPPPGEDAEVTRTSRAGDRKKAEVAPPPGAFVNEGVDEDWC